MRFSHPRRARIWVILFAVGVLNLSFLPAANHSVRLREVVELVFESPEALPDSFDVDLVCIVSNDSGDLLEIPGFYDGGKRWIVRFYPPSLGRWKAETRSSREQLNGMARSVDVTAAAEGDRGALRVDPKRPSQLVYEDGSAYRLLGFECDWYFALDYGEEALSKSKVLAKEIALHGFNQLIMNVYAFDVIWPKDPDLDPVYEYGGRLDIFPFGGNNAEPDFTTLNLEFFQHLDRLVELLDDEQIVAHLMIYVWNKGVSWPEPESKADNLFFDYVVKRYQAYPNVLWDISKEALGYGRDDVHYITRRIERLRALDAYDRLVTVHDYGYCSEYPEKVDIISVQTWKTDLYSKMIDMGQAFPDRPLLNIEHGGYETGPYLVFRGDYTDPVACLRRNYQCAFAGVSSVYYWQNTSWNVIIHDLLADEVHPKPNLAYYRYFSDLMERIQVEDLLPSETHGTSGLCLVNEEKGRYVYYIPEDNESIIVQDLKKGDRIRIVMFDPLTGKYSKERLLTWRKNVRIYNRFASRDGVAIVDVID